MKPGATTSPVASITRSAPPSEAPTATTLLSTTATSPTASIPLAGSTTRPPEITKPLISSLPHAELASRQIPGGTTTSTDADASCSQGRLEGEARKEGQFSCGSRTRARSLAAGLPELCFSLHTFAKKGRREDRAPAGTHNNPQANLLHTQCTGETQGSRDQAFPARWFDSLCRALPGDEFLLAYVTSAKFTAPRR